MKQRATKLILGSNSARRREILKKMGYQFEVLFNDMKENVPKKIPIEKIAPFLAKKKTHYLYHKYDIPSGAILLTVDTIVCYKDEILQKPKNKKEAIKTLKKLSNKTHKVISAVCLSKKIGEKHKKEMITAQTKVTFCPLNDREIETYVSSSPPLDKAGSYGIQDWIGMMGISSIKGSYYNVVGLPTDMLYTSLKNNFSLFPQKYSTSLHIG